MRKLGVLLTLLLGQLPIATASVAGPALSYSPLTAVASGPSGPASAQLVVGPHCCPSTAIIVQAPAAVGEDAFQFVEIGLTTRADRAITRLRVCYEIDAPAPGLTYISQTRLTDMETPDAAFVILDDATDRTDLGPTCYNVDTNLRTRGAVTLALKIVIDDPADAITIGAIKLRFD